MKRTFLQVLGCVLLASCAASRDAEISVSSATAAGVATNSFGIYLTSERTDLAHTSSGLSRVILKSPPVISDSDIVAVDLINGLMKVKPEVFKQLPAPSSEGTQFVAVADGEHLFLGAFWSYFSSLMPAENATIGLDRLSGQDCLSLGWFDPRSGRGGSGWWLGKEAAPGDLWSDPRIKQCLGKLHKLHHVTLP